MFIFRTDAAIASLRETEADVLSAIRQAFGQAAVLAQSVAKSTTTWKDRSGETRRKIVRGARSEWALFVKAGSRISRWLEDGTKPHVIEGKNGGFLRFVVAGQVRYVKRVNHPGTKATHFMQTARDRAETALFRWVESGINRAVA